MRQVRDIRVRPDLLCVASGWSALVTDPHGRITGHDPEGFYAEGMRVLSRERITVDGRQPTPFSTANVGAHAQLSYAELADGEQLPSRALYLTVERFVGRGLRSRFAVHNWGAPHSEAGSRALTVRVEVAADFADRQEAEEHTRQQSGPVTEEWDARTNELRLAYGRTDLDRAVTVRVEADGPIRYAEHAVIVELTVCRGESAAVVLVTEPLFEGRRLTAPAPGYPEPADPAARARAALATELTRLRSGNPDVTAAWDAAVTDLAQLPLGEPPGPAAPIAGLPAYQQVFGRDMLTASWQALLAGPTMLRDSLRLTAARLGERYDDWRDEQPGKPLHQSRPNPLSRLGRDPFAAYYGDWATPLDFLIFLGQYLAWTGDRATVRDLLPAAHRVLGWLDRDADLDRDGFLEYRRRSPAGLKNQGWKDSETAIIDAAGQQVANPIASSELQGYHYAALRHAAVAFVACGEGARGARLAARAAVLRRRFHAAYWLPDLGSYAMALGPDRRPVRSVSSNDGHLLATGIVPRSHARQVARRLLAPDMFSGWGVRTLSADHPAYNPFSYHRGSVWPVEAGTIGLGLARYGRRAELDRVAEGMFAAAALFEGHRLPEVISGQPRVPAYPHPGVYPEASLPQAWSASAVVALIQALLTLRPVGPLRTILVDPHLPAWLPALQLRGVQVGGATFDLTVRRRRGGRVSIRTSGDRIAVVRRRMRQART
jgi:glycogen debranching enzyme